MHVKDLKGRQSKKLFYELNFVELVFTGLKSNRTNKTNNQNPFECILMTDKIRSNGNSLFDLNQIKPIVQITTKSAKLNCTAVY